MIQKRNERLMNVQTGNNGRVGARETNPSAQITALAMSPSRCVLRVYVLILIEEPGNSYNNQYSFLEGCQVRRVEAISFWD